VWEEYSKESETTILFVKLMFDLLKQGGRCAVVVSEGFLTWGQNSACALRKLLLNEANLRACHQPSARCVCVEEWSRHQGRHTAGRSEIEF